jgi:hypothetical protein
MQSNQTTPAQPSTRLRALRQVLPHMVILPTIALLLSGVMAWANGGFDVDFYARWGRGFLTSLVVLPLILASLGVLEGLVNRVFASLHWVGRKTLVALLTAVVMESVLALVLALLNNPWGSPLAPYWWAAFSRSLPMGMVIGLSMSFYIKPKLDQMART